MIKAAITAVGAYVPKETLSNADLEKMVDTNHEWIVSRTGIKNRHILKQEGKATSDMAVEAVKQIFIKRKIKAEEIDVVIFATTTPDMVFPASANILADKLGIKNAYGFDVQAACSGFLYALNIGTKLIESGQNKKVLVIGADKMSSIIDYTDRATCIIFGDGAGAVLLEPSTNGEGIGKSYLKSDGVGRHHLHQKAGGSLNPASFDTVKNKQHFVYQEGAAVFKWAVVKMAESCEEVLKMAGLKIKDVDWLVPHQANKRIIDVTAGRLGLDPKKVMLNIEKYGNTTNATIPLCLNDWETRLNKGDQILLTAFGGGFTWGAIQLTWAY